MPATRECIAVEAFGAEFLGMSEEVSKGIRWNRGNCPFSRSIPILDAAVSAPQVASVLADGDFLIRLFVDIDVDAMV